MKKELPLDYLHHQVEGLIYEHHFMPKYLPYEILQDVIKQEFERMKQYQEYLIIQFASEVAAKFSESNINIDSIKEFYHENFYNKI